MAPKSPGRELLRRIAADLGIDPPLVEAVPAPARPVPLPSRLATGDLAWASVTAASLAARPGAPREAAPDPARIAVGYRSDRVLRIDGAEPPVWAPLSGFWRAADGWVRTHGNYPHHARALTRALQLGDDASADDLRARFAALTVRESVERIDRSDGLAVAVEPEDAERDRLLRQQPLIDIRRLGDAPPRSGTLDETVPLHGTRVLDLTRVIAGPVCTRTLALFGADVLRIDPPYLPEPAWQHLDTGHGKRSALLDATSDAMDGLLSAADIVVLGYRPSALRRLGLSPEQLAARHPGLVIAELSAWGHDRPDRRGFDSLVQAESGIALAESADGERPGALPAQALDHSAGYLLAAAVCVLRRRQLREGGTWSARTSLRRIAAELLGMPRSADPTPAEEVDPTPHTQEFTVAGRSLVTARSALPGFTLAAPRPWAEDEPVW